MRRAWRWVATMYRALFAAAGIFLGGVVAMAAFVQFVDYTNTMGFCISCHEMRDIVYEEFRKSVHFANRTGVEVACANCHVPHNNLVNLVVAKTLATRELYHHIVGTSDTPEKFEARRLQMAQRVWATMKATDSRECRSCHKTYAMDFDKQRPRSVGQHKSAVESRETCIDCHKGIAHKPIHKALETKQDDQDFQITN